MINAIKAATNFLADDHGNPVAPHDPKKELTVLLIVPGSTEMDEQGRIKGSLDIPLSNVGEQQVEKTADELKQFKIDLIYTSACQFSMQTAREIANGSIKVRVDENLENIDHGLWHGKRVDELKSKQPRVYRQWGEHPETVCPPSGETIESAEKRIQRFAKKLLRTHRKGVIGVVIAEPLASLFRSELESTEIGNLWQAGKNCGNWKQIVFA